MEICDTLRKSVLKKSSTSVLSKSKKVTFSSTVKVFLEENSDKKKNIIDRRKNCVEINIVDKSSNDPSSTDISKTDDCNATDFLVHKVIYENETDHDEDCDTDVLSEEAEDNPIVFDINTDEEGLQFVVHKVTDHEDDLIQQELDFEDTDTNVTISSDSECNNDLIGKLSELSIENILTHDKIIAFIDQKSLGLASVLKNHASLSEIGALPPLKDTLDDSIIDSSKMSSCLKNSDVVLSPPLQELSLDKIVKAQSNSVLCELDISPLNSIQETDSDSDLSSEGTMIMMTTEESEKNEQHIRESFLKYQALRKEKTQIKNSEFLSDSSISDDNKSQNNDENALKTINCDNMSTAITDKDISDKNIHLNFKSDIYASHSNTGSLDSCSESEMKTTPPKRVRSTSMTDRSVLQSYNKDFSVSFNQGTRRISFTTINNPGYWDKSLESVQIPNDVREWKIILSSPEKSSNNSLHSNDSSLDSYTLSEEEYLASNSDAPSPTLLKKNEATVSPRSDELETFVHASTERVQRIRKRYLDKTQKKIGIANSPVRGIRPRFGSTAEILRLMQKKNQPPLFTFSNRNHVSWPCDDTLTNSNISAQKREHLSHVFGYQILPGAYSLQSSFSSCVSEDSSSSTCDHDSVSSCPSIFFQERGVPEGASPPRSLSEDSIEQCNNDQNPSNIVYFSMKV